MMRNQKNAGSGKLDSEKGYSPVEAEAIALSRAIEACHHWLYGLFDLMKKNHADVDNKKLQKNTGDSFKLSLGIGTYKWK